MCPIKPGSHHKPGNGSKVHWMANAEDMDIFEVTGNNPLSILLSSLKDMLGFRHLSSKVINKLHN
jgi:hypothetical protein